MGIDLSRHAPTTKELQDMDPHTRDAHVQLISLGLVLGGIFVAAGITWLLFVA